MTTVLICPGCLWEGPEDEARTPGGSSGRCPSCGLTCRWPHEVTAREREHHDRRRKAAAESRPVHLPPPGCDMSGSMRVPLVDLTVYTVVQRERGRYWMRIGAARRAAQLGRLDVELFAIPVNRQLTITDRDFGARLVDHFAWEPGTELRVTNMRGDAVLGAGKIERDGSIIVNLAPASSLPDDGRIQVLP